MTVFIDSANKEDIKRAMQLGWVAGVTTNPLLLSQEPQAPTALFEMIRSINSGPVFYQLMGCDVEQMVNETEEIFTILGDQLVLKLLPTDLGLNYCARFSNRFQCCVTAVFSLAQAAAAAAAGAKFIAIYYHRLQNTMGGGEEFIRKASSILSRSGTEIVAASIKTSQEAVEVLAAGAQHLAAPLDVLMGMIDHEMSDAAIAEFYESGTWINK